MRHTEFQPVDRTALALLAERLACAGGDADRSLDLLAARAFGTVVPEGSEIHAESRSIEEWPEHGPAYTSALLGPGLVMREIERLLPGWTYTCCKYSFACQADVNPADAGAESAFVGCGPTIQTALLYALADALLAGHGPEQIESDPETWGKPAPRPAYDMPEPARGYCLTCIDRLAAHMTPMAAAERHAMLMALACCETPEVFEGPSPDDLGRLDTAGLARVIKENAYPYDGDLTLAFCHAVERGLVDDIRDAAMAAINAK